MGPDPAVTTTDAERADLRAAVRDFLARRSPVAEARRVSATPEGYDPVVWAQLSDQLGLPGLLVPPQYGGAGAGLLEVGVVLEEMGRVLLCAPYLSSAVLAVTVLTSSGDAAVQAEVLPGLAAGRQIAAVALTGDSGRWDGSAASLGVTARPDGRADGDGDADGIVLDGRAMYVLDGHLADLILVAARIPGGIGIFLVPGTAPGLERTPLPTLDATRPLARLDFRSVAARPVGAPGAGAAILARVLAVGSVALAAEQVGGAEQALTMAVAHARERVQFGRPIGSFQAVKHRCADMWVALEGARVAMAAGLRAAGGSDGDLTLAASVAQAQCSWAYSYITAEAIQVLGGIGFTWDHPAHLYFRRARSSEILLGDPAMHREALAAQLAG